MGEHFLRFGISKPVTVCEGPNILEFALTLSVIGIQHHLLSRILLALYDPKLPRLAGGRTAAVRAMEVFILRMVSLGC